MATGVTTTCDVARKRTYSNAELVDEGDAKPKARHHDLAAAAVAPLLPTATAAITVLPETATAAAVEAAYFSMIASFGADLIARTRADSARRDSASSSYYTDSDDEDESKKLPPTQAEKDKAVKEIRAMQAAWAQCLKPCSNNCKK